MGKHANSEEGNNAESPEKQARRTQDPNATLPDDEDTTLEDSMESMHDATGSPNDQVGMQTRQASVDRATPGSSAFSATPGTSQSARTGTPAPGPGGQQGDSDGEEATDIIRVNEALHICGGAQSQKAPDLNNIAPRLGQDIQVIDDELDLESADYDCLPVRPDEASLKRLTHKELLPPPSSHPVPLDLQIDLDAPEFVANQRIEFLVIMKKIGDRHTPWGFPDLAVLQALLDHVREVCDHDQIMAVALWVRVDASQIATMMLSTINLPLMNKIRHAIRCYDKVDQYKFETYAKISFIKKYGITMYVPANNASVRPARILRTLAFKYPALRCKLRIVHKSVFTDDPPNRPAGKRSRIGDTIVLLDGPELQARQLRAV